MKTNKILIVSGVAAVTAVALFFFEIRGSEQGVSSDSTVAARPANESLDTLASGDESESNSSKPDTETLSREATSSASPTPSSTLSSSREIANTKSVPNNIATTQTEKFDSTISDEDDGEVPRLSQRVYDVISEVQTRQLDDQWEEALNEMNALYAAFEELDPFEQSVLLNYYTNTLLQLQMWQESISAFSLMLNIPDLRSDMNARALMALGQLSNQVGDPAAAVTYYEEWLDFTVGMENMEEQTQRVNQLLNQAKEATSN